MATSNEVLVIEAEERIGRGQELRMEDHLDAIGAAVEKLEIIKKLILIILSSDQNNIKISFNKLTLYIFTNYFTIYKLGWSEV